jgi:hypothetical protein
VSRPERERERCESPMLTNTFVVSCNRPMPCKIHAHELLLPRDEETSVDHEEEQA